MGTCQPAANIYRQSGVLLEQSLLSLSPSLSLNECKGEHNIGSHVLILLVTKWKVKWSLNCKKCVTLFSLTSSSQPWPVNPPVGLVIFLLSKKQAAASRDPGHTDWIIFHFSWFSPQVFLFASLPALSQLDPAWLQYISQMCLVASFMSCDKMINQRDTNGSLSSSSD